MTTIALRAGLLALAALLSACGESLPPTRAEAPPENPPVDPDLPLPPKIRCAPGSGATVATAADCRRTAEAQS